MKRRAMATRKLHRWGMAERLIFVLAWIATILVITMTTAVLMGY